MAIRIPTAGQNAGGNAIVDRVDAGTGPGTIEIRTGTQPTSANDADAGTLLATFELNEPAFAAADEGVKVLDVDPEIAATGVAAGTAAHARCKNSDGDVVFDGSVTASGGGGDFIISTTTVSIGLELTLTSGSITMPAG